MAYVIYYSIYADAPTYGRTTCVYKLRCIRLCLASYGSNDFTAIYEVTFQARKRPEQTNSNTALQGNELTQGLQGMNL